MRVIAGKLGGRNFSSPHTSRTHPMSDKVRGALFNALGDIDGLTMLDAYTGSGACSIEAASRGAAHINAVDADPDAAKTVIENIQNLGLGNVILFRRSSISGWLLNHPGETFDIVLADPPYDDITLPAIVNLSARVNPGGIMVLSWPGSIPPPSLSDLMTIHRKSYGDAQLIFYRQTA